MDSENMTMLQSCNDLGIIAKKTPGEPIEKRACVENHRLCFSVPPKNWHDAFPIGNGLLGAMVYQPADCWEWVINHVDVLTSNYRLDKALDEIWISPKSDDEIRSLALEANKDPHGTGYQDYNVALDQYKHHAGVYAGLFDSVAGKLRIHKQPTDDTLISTEQTLNLSQAILTIDEIYENHRLSCESFVSKEAKCLLLKVKQSANHQLISDIELETNILSQCEMSIESDHAFIKGCLDDFIFILGIKIIGTGGKISSAENKLKVFPENSREFTLAVTVATSLDNENPVLATEEILDRIDSAGYEEIRSKHEKSWKKFWSKSEITIPDKFLEYLWYFNLYSLASTSGEGAKNPQGCALYGLWYNAPARWPNCWYEDVNIQQAFWPVYSSNHMELSQVFANGVNARLPIAHEQARLRHNTDGASFGYPLMHCIGPWYCQYLWKHFLYTMDKNFLRKEAYPVMKEVLAFFENYLIEDEEGRLSIFPSVSPEQGPLTKNDTITLASLKYLLTAAVESTLILRLDADKAHRWEKMLEQLSDYPTAKSKYGEIVLDSEWALPDLYLAHSSLLMPIYPLHQLTGETAFNTLCYATQNQAIGTHNFGWLACAAAALGKGDEAVNILYEKGISHMLYPTGFVGESTKRHIQACSVLFPSIYSPPLMEAGSAATAAILEMLIQSHNGHIHVFPATPDKWQDLSFVNLLAEGAFEVSASMHSGQVNSIRIHSIAGKECCLVNPWSDHLKVKTECNGKTIEHKSNKNYISFNTMQGNIYFITASASNPHLETFRCQVKTKQPLMHTLKAGRRIFVGRNETTDFIEKVDQFLLNPTLGKYTLPRATRYKIDFGSLKTKKNYSAVLPEQFLFSNKYGSAIAQLGANTLWQDNMQYGFGWEKNGYRNMIEHSAPDCVRRDFISGKSSDILRIFLTQGSYQALIVSGDSVENGGLTVVEFPDGHIWETKVNQTQPGFETAVISFDVAESGAAPFIFSSRNGCSWKINLLMINQIL